MLGPSRNSDTDALVSDNQGMAVVLNDFFASVFQDGDRTIDLEGLTVLNCPFFRRASNIFCGYRRKKIE